MRLKVISAENNDVNAERFGLFTRLCLVDGRRGVFDGQRYDREIVRELDIEAFENLIRFRGFFKSVSVNDTLSGNDNKNNFNLGRLTSYCVKFEMMQKLYF